MFKYPFILLLVLLFVHASAQQCIEDRYSRTPSFTPEQLIQHQNIVYGEADNLFSGVTESLELDVWEPDPAVDTVADRPLIVWVHGGSFQSGNRQQMDFYCSEFAARGFVTATVSYRLGWACDPNAGLLTCALCGNLSDSLLTAAYSSSQDLRAALRFLVNHASDYGIDPDWIFLGGVSAGSISAMSAAFMDQSEADATLPFASAIAGPLDTSGNDLTDTYDIKGLINNCGAVFDTSLITDEDKVPVISFHDELDCVVPYGNGRVLSCFGCNAFPFADGSSLVHEKLLELNECTELNTNDNSIGHCFWPQANIVDRGVCFLKRVMCDQCTVIENNSTNASSPCGQLSEEISPTCQADLNSDGVVSTADLLILLSEFGSLCD